MPLLFLCRFANGIRFSFCKEFSEGKTGDRACGKQVPQQRHGKVFQHGTDPDGRKLRGGGTSQNDIEQDSGNSAHGRAHDKDGTAGDDQCAEEGVILFGIDDLCCQAVTDAVAPETGEEENENPHERGFHEGFIKDMVRHVAETAGHGIVAKLMGYIEDLHAIGHGNRHEDAENHSLKFCFRHT